MGTREPATRSRSRARRGARVVVIVLGAVLAGALIVAFAVFPRQTVSRLTHWVGPPTEVVPYAPLSPAPEWHLAVVGDVGDSGRHLDLTGATVARLNTLQPYDGVLLLGDNAYMDGDPAKLPATVFEPFAPVLSSGAHLYAILGNHDVLQGHAEGQVAALGMPGRYWATRQGDVLLVGLDSNALDDEQLTWLDRTLGDSDAPWKIVALHHPPYSAGYQGSAKAVRDLVSPILARHGVQLVLSGHDHDYQRSEVIDGVTYVVTGAASGTRRTGREDFTAQSFAWLSFVDLAVYPDHLVVRAVGSDATADEVGDEVVIPR